MKLMIENNNNGISVAVNSGERLLSKSEVTTVTAKMYDIMTDIQYAENKCVSELTTAEAPVTPVAKPSDSFNIRKRLPNSVVNIEDLSIQQAVTEQALVRCPKCGQSHVLAVNSGNHIYVMRKFYSLTQSDEFRIIAEFDSLTSQDFINMCCKPDTDRKAYFEDIQKAKMLDDKDFAVTNETEVFCPVCCKSSSFMDWKEAYENPLQFFETEHICDACGGEKLEKLIRKHKVYQCDKCGLQTDFKEE